MVTRSYNGPALDLTWQGIHERPSLEDEAEDVVYASDPEEPGEERAENVPIPESDPEPERPDVDGQSTLSDWAGGSA